MNNEKTKSDLFLISKERKVLANGGGTLTFEYQIGSCKLHYCHVHFRKETGPTYQNATIEFLKVFA